MLDQYRNQRLTTIKVGFFAIIAVLIVLFGYGWFRDWFVGNRYSLIRVQFADASNIERGNPVTIFGVKRGRVERIELSANGVLLSLLVDLDFPLSNDTRFVITESNLMGSRQVDIIPGTGMTFLDEKDIPAGESMSGVTELIPKVDEIIESLNDFITKLSAKDGLYERLREMLILTESLVRNVDNLLHENNEEIAITIKTLHQASEELNQILSENREPIRNTFESAADTFANVDSTLAQVNKVIKSLDEITGYIEKEKSTLYKLMNEDDLYESFLRTTSQIDSLMYDIRKNPGQYFRIRIF
jgi:phospholipid/cholesterol/gamma-HCH transport system substrate-binding protein